jgi:hypothetical protein
LLDCLLTCNKPWNSIEFCVYLIFWHSSPNSSSFVAAKQAAEKLGYDKKKWDGGKECTYDDYDWDELPDEQKKAAAVLGYDQATWDA